MSGNRVSLKHKKGLNSSDKKETFSGGHEKFLLQASDNIFLMFEG